MTPKANKNRLEALEKQATTTAAPEINLAFQMTPDGPTDFYANGQRITEEQYYHLARNRPKNEMHKITVRLIESRET